MRKMPLDRQRKWFGLALLAVLALGLAWHFSPGLPVLIGPYASAKTREAGRELFMHEWEPNDSLAQGDGLGPIFNAKSCVACHNQGGVGGGGDNSHNVATFEVMPSSRDPEFVAGTIHAASTAPEFTETFDLVRRKYPIIKGGTRTENHCTYTVPDFDPLHTGTVQTTALFGAGWAERISSKAILSNRRKNLFDGMVREFKLDFDTIPAGRARMLPGGRVGKFGWKAQFATLEEFVAAACANELGLGTPQSEQARPLNRPNYGDDVKPDLNKKQFRALVAFVDTLPRPVEVLPASGPERDQAVRGKTLFAEVGCAVCHVPDLGGVKGVYSDFLLHRITDPNGNGGEYGPRPGPDAPLPPDRPHADEWKTPALWGVADSAPYMHDGRASTLESAISAHGGSAKSVREAFRGLPADQQAALVAFLKTLRAPPAAIPVALK